MNILLNSIWQSLNTCNAHGATQELCVIICTIVHEVIIHKSALPSVYPSGVISKIVLKNILCAQRMCELQGRQLTPVLIFPEDAWHFFTGSKSNQAATSLHQSKHRRGKNKKQDQDGTFLSENTIHPSETFKRGGCVERAHLKQTPMCREKNSTLYTSEYLQGINKALSPTLFLSLALTANEE